jgi:hypothetical protein
MIRFNIKSIILLLIVFGQAQVSLANQAKIALVIGNASYQNAPLANPVNDAYSMATTLETLGFDVSVYTDLDRKKMREVIREFGEKLKNQDVGLFYFAGHGVQIKGKNYLVPVSADVRSADEVEDESIDANSVLRKMETAGNAVNIVILDACRNNPFTRSFRNLEQGLARMDGPVGSYIAYATAPGSVAADGEGSNGMYTQHLLAALKQPGLTIEQTFKQVRNNVRRDTEGQQIPWESSSLTGEFVFSPAMKQAQKNEVTAPPLVVVTNKSLQIIGNVPHAKVWVNNEPRGQLDESGVLNLENLFTKSAEVEIKAPGYTTEKSTVELDAGQWKQLNIVLKPSSRPEMLGQNSIRNHSATRSNHCLPGERAIMVVRSEYSPFNKKPRVKINGLEIHALLHNAFSNYELDFIDMDTIIDQRMYKRIAEQDISFYQELAKRFNVDYLIKAEVSARETPIKVVSTTMKTINGDVTLAIIDLKTGKILSEASNNFTKAGVDMTTVINKNVRQQANGIVDKLLIQVCSD